MLLKDSTRVQVEFVGVAKVLQSEKNAAEILEAVENETLESHSMDALDTIHTLDR